MQVARNERVIMAMVQSRFFSVPINLQCGTGKRVLYYLVRARQHPELYEKANALFLHRSTSVEGLFGIKTRPALDINLDESAQEFAELAK